MENPDRRLIRFGTFEADPAASELRKSGRLITVQDQPFRLLMLLLERHGEVVTRDELRQKLWGETYVDFEEGLNTAIRKLRDALGDSASNPRFVETLPRRGYRFIAPVEVEGLAQPDPQSVPEPMKSGPRRRNVWWLAFGGCAVALVIGAGVLVRLWLFHEPPGWTGSPPTQLTRDSGVTTDPVISRDGRLLAYASDRDGTGNLDIWVQHIPGGEARRLTSHPADDHEPDISPDGSEVVFRSERDGGGIYSVSTLGGEPRLTVTAKDAYVPRFSPDGSRIAYSVGSYGSGGFGGSLRVYSRATGATQIFAPALLVVGAAAWSPDGKFLVFAAKKNYGQPYYLWICQADNGPATQMSADPIGGEAIFIQRSAVSVAWFDNQLIVSVLQGDSSNLWVGTVSSATRRLAGKLRRITLGSGSEVLPSVSANGKLVFASHDYSADIWEATLDKSGPSVSMRRLTKDRALNYRPSVSADGSKLAYISNRTGNFDLWVKDLASGKDVALTRTVKAEIFAAISRDGSQAATWDGTSVYLVSATTGVARLLCENPGDVLDRNQAISKLDSDNKCGLPSDWSADGKLILAIPSGIGVWDTENASLTKIAAHQTLGIRAPKLSPDGKWLAFHLLDSRAFNASQRQILVSPYTGRWVPPSSWIAVTDGKALDREPQWSADGNLIYFLSDRDGFRCIWARKLNPKTKQPLGSIYPLVHLHDPRLSLLHVPNTGQVSICAVSGKLIFAMGELTGNIWMTELHQQ